ncbi:MAG: hypothetical protein WC718_07145 [Phycisphaerales bacterium]
MTLQPELLTLAEKAVLDLLVEAVNSYNKLPIQHPMHQAEFTHAIHEAQRLVMSRPVARAYGWTK